MRNAPTLSPDAEKRLMRGLAVQPFLTALLGFIFFPGWAHQRTIDADAVQAAIAFGVLVGMVGTFITVCAAYPAVLWLLKRDAVTLPRTLIAGTLLGNIPAAIAVIAASVSGRGDGFLLDLYGSRPAIALGSLVGITSAAVFWWMAGRQITTDRSASTTLGPT